MDRRTVALSLALAGSLALNGALAFGRRGAPPAPPTAPRVSDAPSVDRAPEPAADRCAAELDACKKRNWEAVWETISRDRRRAAAAPVASASAPAASASARAEGISDPDRMLLDGTKSLLRDVLLAQGAEIVGGLATLLRDGPGQERAAAQAAAEMSRTANLHGPEALRLEADYVANRKAHVAASLASLSAVPPDVRGALDELRRGYADEDRLMAERGGPGARDAWADSQRDQRAAIVALLATLADVPWSEAMRW